MARASLKACFSSVIIFRFSARSDGTIDKIDGLDETLVSPVHPIKCCTHDMSSSSSVDFRGRRVQKANDPIVRIGIFWIVEKF